MSAFNMTVLDATGAPVIGALVTVQTCQGEQTDNTNDQGKATISICNNLGSNNTWKVSAAGFQNQSGTYHVPALFWNNVSVTAVLKRIAGACVGTLCPPGYTCVNGDCVEATHTNPLDLITSNVGPIAVATGVATVAVIGVHEYIKMRDTPRNQASKKMRGNNIATKKVKAVWEFLKP